MEFLASLKAVKVDSDGESQVVLLVPQSELQKVAGLMQATNVLLKVNITEGE